MHLNIMEKSVKEKYLKFRLTFLRFRTNFCLILFLILWLQFFWTVTPNFDPRKCSHFAINRPLSEQIQKFILDYAYISVKDFK